MKALTLLALLGCGAALSWRAYHHAHIDDRRLAIEVMRALPQSFWVLETTRQVAVVTVDDGGLLWGPRVGQATACRRIHYGLAAEGIGPDDITVEGRRVLIKVPNPSVFESAIDPSTVRLFSKRSALQVLRDLASGRSLERELLEMLNKATPEYTGEDLQAQRQSFVDRLNRCARQLFSAKGLDIEFR